MAASRVADEIVSASNGLDEFPDRGRPVPKTQLRELVTGTPYIVRYLVEAETVVILRVRHAARRPTNP